MNWIFHENHSKSKLNRIWNACAVNRKKFKIKFKENKVKENKVKEKKVKENKVNENKVNENKVIWNLDEYQIPLCAKFPLFVN